MHLRHHTNYTENHQVFEKACETYCVNPPEPFKKSTTSGIDPIFSIDNLILTAPKTEFCEFLSEITNFKKCVKYV